MDEKIINFLQEEYIVIGSCSDEVKCIHAETDMQVTVRQLIDDGDRVSKLTNSIFMLQRHPYPLVSVVYEINPCPSGNVIAIESYDRTLQSVVDNLSELNSKVIFAEIIDAVYYLQSNIGIIPYIHANCIYLDDNGNIRIDPSTSCNRCFMPPESLIGQRYNEQSIIWSLGVLLYFMMTKKLPFYSPSNSKHTYNVFTENLHFPLNFSSELSNLLERMLSREPLQRITLEGIMRHQWLAPLYRDIHNMVQNVANCAELDQHIPGCMAQLRMQYHTSIAGFQNILMISHKDDGTKRMTSQAKQNSSMVSNEYYCIFKGRKIA